MFKFESGIVKGHDGIDLYSEVYTPENREVKLNVLVIHGYGEHLGRYKNFVDFFKDKEIGFYFYDQRGHGRSAGKRGHINSFAEYTNDVELLVKKIKSENSNIPLVVMGISMGGLVLLNFLIGSNANIDGALAVSPLVELKMKISPVKEFAAKILKYVAPSLALTSDFDSGGLSHDPNVAKEYLADALVHQYATSSWYFSVQDAMRNVINAKKIMQVPILALVSGNDRIVNTDASIRFFKQFSNTTVKLYKDYYHEPLFEIGKELVYEDIYAFLVNVYKNK